MMKKRLLYYFIIVIILWMNTLQANAQENTSYKQLSEDDIADLKELVLYDETVKRLVPKEWEMEANDIEVEPSADLGAIGSVFSYLMYIILALVVVVILVILFSNIQTEKKIDKLPAKDASDIEDIEEIDAITGLDLAIGAEDYRGAVRMLFIRLLQVLVEEKSIKWRPEKTNRNYLSEMADHTQAAHFRTLVMAYDNVWYGSQEIDKSYFEYLRGDFEKFYSTTEIRIGDE